MRGQQLSNREKEVVRYIAFGASVDEISLNLQISNDTVRQHIKNVKSKLQVNKSTEIAAWFYCSRHREDLQLDPLGNISRILGVMIFLLLFGYAELMQLDYVRTARPSARTVRTVRSGRRTRRNDDYLFRN